MWKRPVWWLVGARPETMNSRTLSIADFGIDVDYVMRRGGVDDIVGDAVSSGVDVAKSAGKKIASFFGW